MRQVKVRCSDGTILNDSYGTHTSWGKYEIFPGDACKVEPPNVKKLKHRGRTCVFTGNHRQKSGEVRVRFLDTKRFGYVNPVDLVPENEAIANEQ